MEKGDEREIVIRVRVVPRASKEKIVEQEGGVFKIKLKAPPVDGKANKALEAFLASVLGIAKSRVEIVSGDKSRLKRVRIRGIRPETVQIILEEAVGKG